MNEDLKELCDVKSYDVVEVYNYNVVHVRSRITCQDIVLKATKSIKEVEILKTLKHSNIIKCFCTIEGRNSIIIVMEYIKKKSIILNVKVCKEISECIKYIHSQNIIHCDIKPDNIICDETNKPYIIDFGIAQYMNESKYRRVGTLDYVAPEIVEMEGESESKLTGKVDIWSFGILMYESIFGKCPFYNDNEVITTGLILWGKYIFPYETKFNEVIKRCLEKKTKLRIDIEELNVVIDDIVIDVLIIDDNKVKMRILSKYVKEEFKKQNLYIRQAVDGKEGYEKMCEIDYDLIFSDEYMPYLNGSKMFEKYEGERVKTYQEYLYSGGEIICEGKNIYPNDKLILNFRECLAN